MGEQRIKIGTLAFDDRKLHASQFCYETAWLMKPEAFAGSAAQHFVNDAGRKSPFPLAFSDTEPDRWGRQVMLRAFRKSGIAGRSLCALDFLLGVDDFARTGALRFALDDEAIEGSGQGRRRTPPLIDLGKIARMTQRFELQQETLDLLQTLPNFELPPAAAAKAWQAVIAATENWRRIAQHPDVGMTASDIRDYAPAFSPVRLRRAKAALRRLQQS